MARLRPPSSRRECLAWPRSDRLAGHGTGTEFGRRNEVEDIPAVVTVMTPFTATDACRVYCAHLRELFPERSGGQVA
jgi:hypothetical protein